MTLKDWHDRLHGNYSGLAATRKAGGRELPKFRVGGDFNSTLAVGKHRGISNAQIALAWVLHQPGVTAPIVGASKMPHLEDAVKALDLKLDESELKALSESYLCHPVLGHS